MQEVLKEIKELLEKYRGKNDEKKEFEKFSERADKDCEISIISKNGRRHTKVNGNIESISICLGLLTSHLIESDFPEELIKVSIDSGIEMAKEWKERGQSIYE